MLTLRVSSFGGSRLVGGINRDSLVLVGVGGFCCYLGFGLCLFMLKFKVDKWGFEIFSFDYGDFIRVCVGDLRGEVFVFGMG